MQKKHQTNSYLPAKTRLILDAKKSVMHGNYSAMNRLNLLDTYVVRGRNDLYESCFGFIRQLLMMDISSIGYDYIYDDGKIHKLQDLFNGSLFNQ